MGTLSTGSAADVLHHPAGHAGIVTGRHPHIDDARPTGAHGRDALAQRADELLRIVDRADAVAALGAGDRREIDVGLADLLADPTVLDRAAARPRDALLVQ